nr:hypothetical protein [Tanacetum cinerariifolium]
MGEGSPPATKRKKTIDRKDGHAVSRATSSSKPLRTINLTDPFGTVAETAELREDHSPHVSSHRLANRSVHTYYDTHVNEETDTLQFGTFGDQSGRVMTNVNTKVVQSSLMHRPAHHSPTATRSTSPPQSIQLNVEAGESSSRGSLYVLDWSIHQRCHLDTHMWAWFSLARGALAQTDIIERFERLQADFDQLAETHLECGETVNKDQALRIKELEDELARKDSALKKMKKFECVCKLLPTVVERLLQSYEYKQSMYEPFNQAIQAGWGKGLSEERSKEDHLEHMSRMENFDAYVDKKMCVEYDKLFEKRYPYVEKISCGFCYPVSDLLKACPLDFSPGVHGVLGVMPWVVPLTLVCGV